MLEGQKIPDPDEEPIMIPLEKRLAEPTGFAFVGGIMLAVDRLDKEQAEWSPGRALPVGKNTDTGKK